MSTCEATFFLGCRLSAIPLFFSSYRGEDFLKTFHPFTNAA